MDKESSLLETSFKSEVAELNVFDWKPSTSLSILSPRTPIEACDVLDKAFGGLFLNELKEEIHQNDIITRLKPSRTAMDNKMEQMNELLATNLNLSNDLDIFSHLKERSKSVRDDLSVIIPRSFRSTDVFCRKYPKLFRLITSIEHTAKKNLSKSTLQKNNKKNSTWIDFDSSMTSVQLASYPGDGISGYARHCDTTTSIIAHSSKNDSNADITIQKNPQRIITAVYYITEDDWCRDRDGGCLRIFENSHDDDDDDGQQEDHYDIVPYADRLVLFRSDLVEHQVLPSTARTRLAITVWLYGHLITAEPNTRNCQVQSPDISQIEKGSDSITTTTRGTGIPLPLPSLGKLKTSEQNRQSIYVSIPAYKDTETHPTILSLIQNAKFPQRVFVGVVYQYDVMSPIERSKYQESPLPNPWCDCNFRSITLDYRAATGPCYARYLGQSLHRGEEYILQIDSHMRFRPNWDVYLIDQLEKCQNPSRAVLTTYPPGYYLPNNIPEETRATILTPWKFDRKNILRQKGRVLERCIETKLSKSTGNDNIPCMLYAGGFNFSMSKILSICPYEELHHLFFGEEISMAVRLYTHGFDLYAPPQSVCYHLWSRNHRPIFQTDIGESSADDCNNEKYENLAVISRDRVFQQLLGNVDGFGTIRTASEFANALRVDFTKFIIEENAVDVGLDPTSFVASQTVEPSTSTSSSEVLETILGIVADNQASDKQF